MSKEPTDELAEPGNQAGTSIGEVKGENVAVGNASVTQVVNHHYAAERGPPGERVFVLHDAADHAEIGELVERLHKQGHQVIPPR